MTSNIVFTYGPEKAHKHLAHKQCWEVLKGAGVDGVGGNFPFLFSRFSRRVCIVFFVFFFPLFFSLCLSSFFLVPLFFVIFFVSGEFSVFCTFPGSCCRLSLTLRPPGKQQKIQRRDFRSDPVYTNPLETFRQFLGHPGH